MNVKVNLDYTIYDGAEIVFKAPCDASRVTGLIVYYPNGTEEMSSVFTFADAHTNDLGNIDNLFVAGAVVKVILDTETNMAFVQNAATNAYLEGRFAGIGGGGSAKGAVLYTEQKLTQEQKARARANIDAVGGMVITFDDDLNCSHSYDQIIFALKSGLPVLYVRFHDEGYSYTIAISSGTVRWKTAPLGESFTLYAGNELALFYDEEAGTEGWVEYHESSGGGGGGGSVEGAVLYNDWQDLTPEEQAQARENIGAADAETIGDISSALDELHAYAEALKGGGAV